MKASQPRTLARLAFALAAVSGLPASLAQPSSAQLQACASCHGAQGESLAGDIPNLAGQKRDYLAQQLAAFKAGERKSELMQAITRQLSAQDIQALAAYWAGMPRDATPAVSAAIPSQMPFPAGFPAGLSEYDRELDPATQTVFVRYANAKALAAARAGRPLPPGSVLMTGEYAAALDAQGQPRKDAQGQWAAGALQSVSGMQAENGWGQAVPPLLRNADWHYGQWSPAGQSRLGANHARCLACHKPLDAQQHVFTLPALRRPPSARAGLTAP